MADEQARRCGGDEVHPRGDQQQLGKLDEEGPGLTVNAVAPGFVATEMLETVPEKRLDRIRGQIPVGRLGRPEEIARVVAFLSEDESA